MKEINLDKFEVYRDPRWPPWTQDRRVWAYLRANYGIGFGGWVDDGEGPPMVTFVKTAADLAITGSSRKN